VSGNFKEFEDETESFLPFRPFGDGQRNCIGMRLGKINVKIGLALLLSRFNFELSDPSMYNEEIQFHPSKAVLFPSKEFTFKLKPRRK
jgi:cytochrome P450 family 6